MSARPEPTEGPKNPLYALNPEVTRHVLTRFIVAEAGKVGFKRVVVGLSGGIDSSLSAALAVEALGSENVLGVMMPYKTSSPASAGDAELLADQLKVPTLTVEITEMVGPFFRLHPDMPNKRRGNIMARMRMVVLYDQSEAFGGLVLGTSNKTELLLGYGTLFGDMASAINPIGDLYKTQVRVLSRAVGIPDPIIAKPPTADLWEGQSDETEMGLTYESVDQVLYYLIDERYSPDEIVALGFDEPLVRRVVDMVKASQFKRRLPLIAKVSARTIDRDFRYPRDWGR